MDIEGHAPILRPLATTVTESAVLRRNPTLPYPEQVESVTLDAVDRGLLHALQIDGRAAFSRIAEVLDVSDRTVARRYTRMRAHGLLRITAVPDNSRLGYAEWLVRIKIRPGTATPIARALTLRPDTSWVSVLSSGTEVACFFRIPNEGPAPLESLARHPQILTLEAHLLHHLTADPWRGRTAALTTNQVDALRPSFTDAIEVQTANEQLSPETPGQHTDAAARSERNTFRPGPARTARSGRERPAAGEPGAEPIPTRPLSALTDLDRRLLPELARDGRADFASLARSLDWSESAVRRRLEELRRSRIVRFDVEIDSATLGFRTQAVLWLTVAPGKFLAVADALAGQVEVAFVGATTGPQNLIAIVVCRDTRALFDYVTNRVGPLDGIEHMETTPITAIAKRAAPAH